MEYRICHRSYFVPPPASTVGGLVDSPKRQRRRINKSGTHIPGAPTPPSLRETPRLFAPTDHPPHFSLLGTERAHTHAAARRSPPRAPPPPPSIVPPRTARRAHLVIGATLRRTSSAGVSLAHGRIQAHVLTRSPPWASRRTSRRRSRTSDPSSRPHPHEPPESTSLMARGRHPR